MKSDADKVVLGRSGLSRLAVYMSGSCNLKCSYCYAGSIPGEVLRGKVLFRVIDALLSERADDKKITFLGGEPLLQGELLKAAILRIRRMEPVIPVCVVTNGTLLDPGWLSFFSAHKVAIMLSLDGDKSSNDGCRKFRAGRASVFSAVLKRIPYVDRGGISVNMVVTPATAGRLHLNILHLLALGFKRISWVPDITGEWRGADVEVLRRSAAQAKSDYFRIIKKGLPPYEVANIYESLSDFVTGNVTRTCVSITLGPDGRLYPCDKLMAVPRSERRRFAMKLDGKTLDVSGLRRFFKEASRDGVVPCTHCCAVGAWALSRFCGRYSDGLPGFLAGQQALRKVVSQWLSSMAREGLKSVHFRKVHAVAGKYQDKG